MSLALGTLVNADRLEKVVLAKRVSRFMIAEGHTETEVEAATNIARALAQDLSAQVREVLAFELRFCSTLPHDLAARIATDVESVSGPFIETTMALTDSQWAGMIPHLEEFAHTRLSRRSDLGEQSALALVASGSDKTAVQLFTNLSIKLSEHICTKAVDRFHAAEPVMTALGARVDLPLSIVERILTLVTENCRHILMANYALSDEFVGKLVFNSHNEALWRQIAQAGPAQVHGYVVDLKQSGRLTEMMVLDMVERGSGQFLASALALEAGLTLGQTRQILAGGELRAVLELVRKAGYGKTAAQRIFRVLKSDEDDTDQVIKA